MEKVIGKVIEVFIPTENGIESINSTKIGFKIKIDDKIVQIIQQQNEENSNILKNDIVVITKQIISEKEFIDIELFDRGNHE